MEAITVGLGFVVMGLVIISIFLVVIKLSNKVKFEYNTKGNIISYDYDNSDTSSTSRNPYIEYTNRKGKKIKVISSSFNPNYDVFGEVDLSIVETKFIGLTFSKEFVVHDSFTQPEYKWVKLVIYILGFVMILTGIVIMILS